MHNSGRGDSAGEAELIDKLVDLARIISSEASADVAHNRRLELEAALKDKDSQVCTV